VRSLLASEAVVEAVVEALDRATDQNALDFTMSRLPPSRPTQVFIGSNGSDTVAIRHCGHSVCRDVLLASPSGGAR
jgi:hypothetical protein